MITPSNTPREIARQRQDNFAGGTRLLWVLDPPTRTVVVHTRGRPEPVVLTDADALDGADVLPGFTLAVAAAYDVPLPPPDGGAGRQPPPAA